MYVLLGSAVAQWLECWTQLREPRYKSCGSAVNPGQVCSFDVAPVHSSIRMSTWLQTVVDICV